MKKLKHRANIYVIIRTVDDSYAGLIIQAMDSFRTFERAEEMVGVYEQQDLERGETNRDYRIDISTYYDE